MPDSHVQFDRLRLKNVRCFRDAEIPFEKRVTIIVGGNAAGKTTLLECLASLTPDEGLEEFPLRHQAKSGEIALYRPGASRPAARWDAKSGTRARLGSDSLVFLYGRYRRVLLPEEEPRRLSDAEYLAELASHAARSRATTLTRADNRLLSDLPGYLRGIYYDLANPLRNALWTRLNSVLPRLDPSLSEIRMKEGAYHLIPQIVRNGVALDLTELSDGYQALLVIVLDLLIRYAYLFADDDPMAGRALVAIDEIDLHLHPRWQRTVLLQLTELFPGTQFIVTTHSPVVVQSAIDEGFAIVRLVEGEGAVTAQPLSPRLAKALRGAEVGSLLFEEQLFGVESRFSVEYAAIEQRVDELQTRIAGGDVTEAEYAELKNGLDKLEELVAKEDRRRADGSTMGQMVRMQAEFVKALTDELQKARS